MVEITTKVDTSRIKGFKTFSNPINTYLQSNRTLTEDEGFLVPDGHEVLKQDWLDLYNSGTFPDGTTEDYFILPSIVQPTDGSKIYLIGKVLNSNTVNMADGHGVAKNFTNADLDSNKVLTFDHGIAHINPIIQVTDNNNNIVLPIQVVNIVGQSKIKIGREITGTWKVVVYG